MVDTLRPERPSRRYSMTLSCLAIAADPIVRCR
jgi:hypothetical protein